MLIDLIVGILVAVVGIMTLASPVGPDVSTSEWYASGATFAILGLLYVVVGYGLLKAKPWVWLLGLWAGVAYLVLGILTLSSGTTIIILLVGIMNLLFYYFNRADLKRYLGKVRP